MNNFWAQENWRNVINNGGSDTNQKLKQDERGSGRFEHKWESGRTDYPAYAVQTLVWARGFVCFLFVIRFFVFFFRWSNFIDLSDVVDSCRYIIHLWYIFVIIRWLRAMYNWVLLEFPLLFFFVALRCTFRRNNGNYSKGSWEKI